MMSASSLTLASFAKMFLPGISTAMTVVNAVEVLRLANELAKIKDAADRHAQGKQRQRVRKPSEAQCSQVCPACLEQCPEAQGDEDLVGLLSLVNGAGSHIHHGQL